MRRLKLFGKTMREVPAEVELPNRSWFDKLTTDGDFVSYAWI